MNEFKIKGQDQNNESVRCYRKGRTQSVRVSSFQGDALFKEDKQDVAIAGQRSFFVKDRCSVYLILNFPSCAATAWYR
jgi:hypothetical protein